MRDRIAFKSVTPVATALGSTESLVDFATVWARSLPGLSTEVYGVRENRTHAVELTLRYREDITQDLKFVYRGNTYDVTGTADVDGRKRELMVQGLLRG